VRIVKNQDRGFTLTELLIVIVIVSLLLGFALPSYRNFVLRSNRTVAISKLMEVASLQEQFFSNNKTYTADLADLGYTIAAGGQIGVDKNFNPVAPGNSASIYTISSTLPVGTTTFTLTADTKNNQEDDDSNCATFLVTNEGAKSATGSLGGKCWK